MSNVTIMQPFVSRGARISQSKSHENLFIIDYPDGGFVTINSSIELIQKRQRDKDQRFKTDESFKFKRISQYSPPKQKPPTYWENVKNGKVKLDKKRNYN